MATKSQTPLQFLKSALSKDYSFTLWSTEKIKKPYAKSYSEYEVIAQVEDKKHPTVWHEKKGKTLSSTAFIRRLVVTPKIKQGSSVTSKELNDVLKKAGHPQFIRAAYGHLRKFGQQNFFKFTFKISEKVKPLALKSRRKVRR